MQGTSENDLLFEIHYNVNYHRRRRHFFEKLNAWLMFISIIGASSVVASLSFDCSKWSYLAGGVTALTQAIALAIRPDSAAREHQHIISLFLAVKDRYLRMETPSPEQLRELGRELVAAETREPPVRRIVSCLAYNDTQEERGNFRKRYSVGRWSRLFANVLDAPGRPKLLEDANDRGEGESTTTPGMSEKDK